MIVLYRYQTNRVSHQLLKNERSLIPSNVVFDFKCIETDPFKVN